MKQSTVTIGNKQIELKTSAYTPILYSELFNRNIFKEMSEIIEDAAETGNIPFDKTMILYRIAYCMAKQAKPEIPKMEEWLDQFDVFDVFDIVEDMIKLWTEDNQTQSTP